MTLLATITEHARVAPTGAMVVGHARDLWVEHKDRTWINLHKQQRPAQAVELFIQLGPIRWRDLADANTDAAR